MMVWKFERSDVFLWEVWASSLRSFPIFCTPKVVKMTLWGSKSRKRWTSGKNGFHKTCSYNLPQHFMFWWPRLNIKSEINISKNVEKRHVYRFLTSPHSPKKIVRWNRWQINLRVLHRWTTFVFGRFCECKVWGVKISNYVEKTSFLRFV